ncbi:MAG: hypothetical protein HY704_16635 [Gemmatimonadetes bacterium]|nr:hypothetical protein [Gemmatimonadota bacterium]
MRLRGLTVVFVRAGISAEERAAYAWLGTVSGVDPIETTLSALRPGALPRTALVWIHTVEPRPRLPDRARIALRSHIAAGGGLLLSLGATALAPELELDEIEPNEAGRHLWSDETDDLHRFPPFAGGPRLRGHAAFRSHPVLAGLGNAVYTWAPRDGEAYTRVTWGSAVRPRLGQVVAVERAYIQINHRRATLWEYLGGDKPILCLGAYFYFAALDARHRPHLEALATAALAYGAGRLESSTRVHHWLPPGTEVRADGELPVLEPPSLRAALQPEGMPFELAGRAEPGRPFTLCGRRVMVAGDEGEGAAEVWAHPLRVARTLRVEGAAALRVRLAPGFLMRELDLRGTALRETILVPQELPAIVMEWTAAAPVELTVSWSTDLRLMWPYPEGALGPLRYRVHGHAASVAARQPDDVAAFAFSARPQRWEVGDETTEEHPVLRLRARFRLTPGERLRFVAVGSTEGWRALEATFDGLRHLGAEVVRRVEVAAIRQAEGLALSAPDPRPGDAVEWAKYRMDSFLVETPRVGRSLVAGYARSREGWGDGRPGYAWYLGRDAVWTALGCLAAGQFGLARDVLEFLGRHQDITGKILHECTTSGVVHYDAADSTPLYLLLAGWYVLWTGDTGTLRREREHIGSALEFCESTLSEDGLVTNTGVGHGWIELGPLGGGHITIYNASIWAAALDLLAGAVEAVGEKGWALDLRGRAARAREAVERRFYDPARRLYGLQVTSQGRVNWTQTALQAVPLLLGVIDPARAAPWLDAVSARAFSAPCGVRFLPVTEPGYDPAAYHGGSIWPLFTGWVAWAEYRAGRAEAAFRHWMSNVAIAFQGERGAWDEVLHGRRCRGIGVCPDQAWSAAMVVVPLVYGMLGLIPDAPYGRVRIGPQFPRAWGHVEVTNVRVGDSHVAVRYHRAGRRHTFAIEQTAGALPLTLIFEPTIPADAIDAVTIDDRGARLEPIRVGARSGVRVQLALDRERTVVLTDR